jgi:peptidoglycan/LPS O-acetylase OafA/YrhL
LSSTSAEPSRAEAPATATRGRFVAGDPLRAVAALSVLVYHAAFVSAFFRGHYGVRPGAVLSAQFGDPLGPLVGHLNLGLYIFFVLSGYLISRPFVRAFVTAAPRPAIGPYVRNRLLRIVPAFWLVLAVVLLALGTLGAPAREVAATYAFLISYLDTPLFLLIGQSWTLGVELVFYAAIPVFAALATVAARGRLGARGRSALVIGGALLIGAASLIIAARHPADQGWQQHPASSLWPFVPGVLLAVAEIRAEPLLRGRRAGRVLAWGLPPVGLALLIASERLAEDAIVARGVLTALGTGALVAGPLVLQWTTGGCWRALDNRVMRWIGERSYSLYLVHVAILYALRDLAVEAGGTGEGFLLLLAAGLPAALAASALSYRFFEVPFLRRRGRWAGSRPPGAARAT